MNKKLWQKQMSLGEILTAGFRLLWINLLPLLLFVVFFHVPANLLRTFLPSVISVEKYGETTFTLIATVISWSNLAVSLFVLTGIAYLVERSSQEQLTSLGDVFKFSFSRFGAVFETGLFLGIIIIGLTLLLIVPGIIWANYYSFAIIITALRYLRVRAALAYSKKLVEGQWWRIFGITAAIWFPAVIFNLSILLLSRKVPDIKFLSSFAPMMISNLVGVITSVMGVVLFLNTESARDFQGQNRGKTNRT
jgi:hypothetical protein